MTGEPDGDSLADEVESVRKFLDRCGGRAVGMEAVLRAMERQSRSRGEDWPWPWVAGWVEEQGPRWVNDDATLAFEIPLDKLSGPRSLDFTQQVWMLQPSLFEYMVWGDRSFVRMWWDRSRNTYPGCKAGP